MPRTWKSLTITGDEDFSRDLEIVGTMPPVHPGEVLAEDFLKPLDLTAYAVAKACGVPRTRIERLAREETPVTADTALRLGRYFGTTPQFWMNLQTRFDLETASRALSKDVAEISPLRQAAAENCAVPA